MVKFSPIFWIVLPGFFFIDNHTVGSTDHSSSEKELKTSGMIRRKRSANDFSPVVESVLKYENLSDVESIRSGSVLNLSETDLKSKERFLSNKFENRRLIKFDEPIDYDLSFNGTGKEEEEKAAGGDSRDIRGIEDPKRTARNDYSSVNDGNKSMEDSQHLRENEFVTDPPIRKYPPDSPSRGLTLIDFNEPVISRDAESLEDQGLTNSEHLRVKRASRHPGTSGEEISFKGDDTSNMRNELADIYPGLIDQPISPVRLIRKKRLNYEMLFPISDSRSEVNQERNGESNEDDNSLEKLNSDPQSIGSPVFFESFSRCENSMGHPESQVEPESSNQDEDTEDYPNSGTNLMKNENDILNPDGNEFGNRYYSKSRKKRFALAGGRAKRRGGARGKKPKSKHRKKHKKKKKKLKKPTGKSHDFASDIHVEYEAPSKREISHFVDELQVESHVEKRDSGDARSEIDLSKREISENHDGSNENKASREKRALIQNERDSATSERSNYENTPMAKSADSHNSECKNGELRYYDEVSEPSALQTQRISVETKSGSLDKSRKERTASSVRQIERLMEKMIDEVDDLETLVNNDEENKRDEKKRAEDFPNSSSSLDGESFTNSTKDRIESEACSDETNSSESRSDIDLSRKDEKTEEKRSRRTTRRGRKPKKRRIRKRKSHRKWDRWTDWSSCSVTCGKGRQIRWRHCIRDCTNAETEMEEKSCQLPACGPGKFLGIF